MLKPKIKENSIVNQNRDWSLHNSPKGIGIMNSPKIIWFEALRWQVDLHSNAEETTCASSTSISPCLEPHAQSSKNETSLEWLDSAPAFWCRPTNTSRSGKNQKHALFMVLLAFSSSSSMAD